MRRTVPKKGFTIAELSISIGYVAILLIAVATLIVYSISIYQKGLTLRSVNNAGLELIDELTRTISNSSNSDPDCDLLLSNNSDKTKCRSNKGSMFYFQANTTVYIPRSEETITAPAYGFFCTGSYSYVWNSGYVLNTDGTYYRTSSKDGFSDVRQTVRSESGAVSQNYRLLRFNDSNRSVCASAWNSNPGNYPATFTTSASPSRTITVPNEVYATKRELMNASSETQLVVFDFHIHSISYQSLTGHALYAGSFTLGTSTGSVNINTTSDTCKDSPDGLSTGFAYCAINKFNFTVRASGKS